MDKNLRSYLIEMAGTFAMVFVSAGAVCAMHAGPESARPTPLAQAIYVGLAYGLVLAVALAITVPYDGGFLNPAITLTLWVYKRMDDWQKLVGLVFVQLLGSAMAGGLLFIIFHQNEMIMGASSLGTPHVNPELSRFWGTPVIAGAIVEFCLTFVLTLVIFGTLIDPRAPRILTPVGRWLAPLWVGLAMFALVLAAHSVTGAAANPARWFGPFAWEYGSEQLKALRPGRDQLAYWVGPILGALAAGGVYNVLLAPPEETTDHASHAAGASKSPAGSTLFRSKK
jgi:glycerol uptake facilitator-like aquaporin